MGEQVKPNRPWILFGLVTLSLAIGLYLITGGFAGSPLSIERQSYQCDQNKHSCYLELVVRNPTQHSIKGDIILQVYSMENKQVRPTSEIFFPTVFKPGYATITYPIQDVNNVTNIEARLEID
ncbi:MAG: hypothetical protein OQJ89_12600 [Kangiellaceae bacterium]|nr:hypothetical protein [Kangiellaceae bacterium]MCW8998767.1 hypothetical protein [Kangiellaceae bacterium]MCW9017802.1 hypothetical protein [Kangiellaceae bacterium]